VGLGALAAGLTVWLITQTTVVERVIRIAAGLVLVYPSLTQPHPSCHRHNFVRIGRAVAIPPAQWRDNVDEWETA